jgi:hypothetical protein
MSKWGPTVAYLNSLRLEKADLSAKIREIEKEYEKVSAPLIDFLTENGLNTIAPDKASATISEETYWNIDDQEAFENWVYETKSLFALQRRLSAATINDLVNAGEEVPGLKSFTKTKLSIKSIK